MRALFAKLFKSTTPSKFPVRIVAFRNEKEFLPFRTSQSAVAFYSPEIERDYIVMRSIAPEHYPAAVHEYMHRIVHEPGLEFPIWLNEGLAELFSTLKSGGGKVQIGQMDHDRVMVVRNNVTIPFRAFMTVGQDSPLYNEREKAGIFYAQAFSLTHMLFFDEQFKAKFGALQAAYRTTKDPIEAFISTYGTTIETVQGELDRYMRQDRFHYSVIDVKLEKTAEDPEISTADMSTRRRP